jgi:hypothetical protein
MTGLKRWASLCSAHPTSRFLKLLSKQIGEQLKAKSMEISQILPNYAFEKEARRS